MATQERITVHNLADLKNTSDDAIPNYLNSLKFKQRHDLVDTRLVLGYSAFIIAGACFLWDYKFGFESTKWATAAAVAVYTVLNTALMLWVTYVEKGNVYQGVTPDGSKISVWTSTKKNVPTYNVKVTVTPKNGKPTTIELARPFAEWFDKAGHFIVPPFQTMLASNVPLIAKADPKRAVKAAPAPPSSSFMTADPSLLDALAGAGTATGAEQASAKDTKRRKA